MIIHKGTFLLALGALTAGGVAGGYYVADQGLLKNPSPPLGATDRQASAPVVTVVEPVPMVKPVAPLCDDTVGVVASCPAPGYPADEGQGCGALPSKRCDDFKKTMKPRVAEHAVACLNALTAGQRCDSNRLNLCAHLALMSACPEPDAPVGTSATATPAPPDDVGSHCQSVVEACGSASFAPSTRDCRATLSGLTSFGRDQMVSCMKTHCADKGLVGCEAVIDVK
jgi:hypothetical protein